MGEAHTVVVDKVCYADTEEGRVDACVETCYALTLYDGVDGLDE